MDVKHLMISVVLGLGAMGGCASSPFELPEALEHHIEPNLTFAQLLEDPQAHQGKMMVLGGEVLSAKRLPEGTQLEVLHLPLDKSRQPVAARTASQGRFLAIEKNFLDPAMFPSNTRVTFVGEVTEPTTAKLDEMDYRYPTVVIRHMHVWKQQAMAGERNPGPWYSIFGGGGTGGWMGGGVGIGIGF